MKIKNKEEKVNIIIKTIQNDESNIWESQGVLSEKDKKYVVEYPDYTSNTATENILEVDSDSMRVVREGAINSEMMFMESIVTTGRYGVMFYDTDIEVFTSNYDFTDEENEMKIHAKYQIFSGGEMLADNEIQITLNRAIMQQK